MMVKVNRSFCVAFLIITTMVMLSGCASVQTCEKEAILRHYQPGMVILRQTEKIILVGGCFDVLHYGHLQFLKKAKTKGGYLIVALEPDSSIQNYKKRSPVHTQQQRAENLASICHVDEVLLLPALRGFEDYNQLVQDVRPAVIAITGDDPQQHNKKKQAEGVNAKVDVVIERLGQFSSSYIIGLGTLQRRKKQEGHV